MYWCIVHEKALYTLLQQTYFIYPYIYFSIVAAQLAAWWNHTHHLGPIDNQWPSLAKHLFYTLSFLISNWSFKILSGLFLFCIRTHTVQNWTYNPKQIWHYFEAIRDSFMIRVNGNYGKNRYSMGYFWKNQNFLQNF